MKTSGKCGKCGGTRIGRFEHVADETDATTGPGRTRSLWWQREGGFFSSKELRADVEAYVCTACGYFEEYVKDPKSVPWEKLTPFRWHRP
jgi:predicted nucleic-acid-binding Zn-ribbon protein